jgi:hypothetical protein
MSVDGWSLCSALDAVAAAAGVPKLQLSAVSAEAPVVQIPKIAFVPEKRAEIGKLFEKFVAFGAGQGGVCYKGFEPGREYACVFSVQLGMGTQ